MPLIEVVHAALDAAEWKYEDTPDGRACWLWFGGRSCDYRCLVTADDSAEQVGVLLRIPQRVPEARRMAVCEYIVRVNWGLRVGCLDLDFTDGEVRFRAAVDAEDCELPPDVVRMFVNHALWTMDTYHDGLMRVAFGYVAPEAAVDAARREERRRVEAMSQAEDDEATGSTDVDEALRELGIDTDD